MTKREQIRDFEGLLSGYNVQVNEWVGTQKTVLGIIGDTSIIDYEMIEAQERQMAGKLVN